jgi:hypothetical protein
MITEFAKYIKENIHFETEKDYETFDIIDFTKSEDKNSLIKYLNENFLGWIELLNDRNIGAKYIYVTKYKIRDRLWEGKDTKGSFFNKDLLVEISEYIIKNGELNHYVTTMRINNGNDCCSLIKRKVKEPIRRYTEDDPYGEEDWENESFEHDDIDPYGEEDWNEENSKFSKNEEDFLEERGFNVDATKRLAFKKTRDGGSIVAVTDESDNGKIYRIAKFDKDDNNEYSIKGGHLGICFAEFNRYTETPREDGLDEY